MNCKDVESLLTAYHEGRLAPGHRAGVEEHLAACPRCRTLEQQMRLVHERLVGLFAAHRLPDDFERAVLKAAGTGQAAPHQPAFSWRALAVWGSIAAAAAVGITLILASMWSVGEIPTRSDSAAVIEQPARRPGERPQPLPGDAVREEPGPEPADTGNEPAEPQSPIEVAGRDTRTPQKRVPVGPETPREASPEGENGHGRPGDSGEQLLTSPLEGRGDGARPPREGLRRPEGPRAGPRRPPVRPGTEGTPEEAQRRRELAERARQRRDNQPEEMEKLEPEERRKLGSGIKESADRGVPPLIAARVVQLVLKKGLTPDDARKALRALNEAAAKGVRPAVFAAGLERMLGSMPEGASFERALKKLLESLGLADDNGKAN